jgi:hypothetical protein
VEERLGEAGTLTQTGAACLWRVLDLRGALPLNHLCRRAQQAPLSPSSPSSQLSPCWGSFEVGFVSPLLVLIRGRCVRRLLAAAGLPYRLIRALDAATAELRSLPSQVASSPSACQATAPVLLRNSCSAQQQWQPLGYSFGMLVISDKLLRSTIVLF